MRWATPERSNVWCSTRLTRSLLLVAAALAALLASTVFRPARTPGPFARDFEAYYAGGATWNAGGNPWSRDVWSTERTIPGVVATRDEVLPFVGPAASLPLWGAFARLPFLDATIVWATVLALAFVLLIGATLALARPNALPLEFAAAGLFALFSGPMLSDFALGQVALLSACGVALTLLALERRSGWAVLAALVAALQPNLALVLAARLFDLRALLALAVAAAAFLALTLRLGGGFGGIIAYLHLLTAHGNAERFVTIQHTLPAVLASFGMARSTAVDVGTGVAMVAAGTGATAAFVLRRTPLLGTSIAIALLPLAIPFFHEHDFVVLIVPALVLLSVPHRRVRALAGLAAVAIFIDWFGLAQRQPAQAQIAMLTLTVALAIVAFSANGRLDARDFAPLGLAVVLLLGAVPLARTYPSPTWPDMLSATYHAAPDADVSTVWGDEQQRSGLEREVPAWGALRAIPLAGSLLLALAGLCEACARRTPAGR